MLGDPYITPTELWYVRNHHPVPLDEGDAHKFSVTTDNGNEGLSPPRTSKRTTLEQQ